MRAVESLANIDDKYEVKQSVLLFSQTSFAEIVDIDINGVTCRTFTDFRTMDMGLMDIELLNCDAGIHLKGLTCRLVDNDKELATSSSYFGGTCSLVFPDLSKEQKEKLVKFIQMSCTISQSIN